MVYSNEWYLFPIKWIHKPRNKRQRDTQTSHKLETKQKWKACKDSSCTRSKKWSRQQNSASVSYSSKSSVLPLWNDHRDTDLVLFWFCDHDEQPPCCRIFPYSCILIFPYSRIPAVSEPAWWSTFPSTEIENVGTWRKTFSKRTIWGCWAMWLIFRNFALKPSLRTQSLLGTFWSLNQRSSRSSPLARFSGTSEPGPMVLAAHQGQVSTYTTPLWSLHASLKRGKISKSGRKDGT